MSGDMGLGNLERLNPNVRSLKPSVTLAINEQCASLESEGRTVYRLGLGESPFPIPDVVVRSLAEHAHEKSYLPVQGLLQLRQAIAQFHNRRDKVSIEADGVIVGPGSKELLFLLQIAFKGDFLLPSPCWVSYLPQAKILGHSNIHIIPTTFEEGWRICSQRLDEVCTGLDSSVPTLLILNYPGNPEGLTYSEEELEKIVAVARKHNIIILSDEIYGELTFDGNHHSIARLYPEGTIISNGLSKWCGAGGWRLGCFSFPKQLYGMKETLAAIASETFTSVCAPVQHAAITAFETPKEVEHYLLHARRILKALGTQCASILRDAGIHVHDPQGAFYLFADFSPSINKLSAKGLATSGNLCTVLLEETGVAILPGSAFLRSEEELTARLSLVNFDGGIALEQSMALGVDSQLPSDFVEKWCAPTLEAVRRIARWVNL